MTTDDRGYHAALASRVRREVLDILRRSPRPLDAAEIADTVGTHVTTARFHLDQLVSAGLADRRPATEKRRGRPRILYSPTSPTRAEDAREQLIHVLATALSREDEAAAEAIRAGRRWATSFDPPDEETDRVPRLVGVLDRLGFDPEPADGEIRLRACPFREAARAHPDVICGVHRGLVDRLLDGAPRGRLVPFVEPELCLVELDGPTDTARRG